VSRNAQPTRRAARWLLCPALLAAACATAGPVARPSVVQAPRQADEPLGPGRALGAGDPAQLAYGRAWEGRKRGDAARDAGNLEQARTDWTSAAEELLAAERAGASGWRLPLGYRAAELLFRSGNGERAAELAARVARDPAADERSRALAWHLAAAAHASDAADLAGAGKLPPVKVLFAEQRGPEPLSPRPPPGAWKSFVDATDAYLAVSEADPDLALPAADQPLPPPQRLALAAARATFAFDDLAEARRRLEALLDRWPGDADVVQEATPLYLQTFLVQGDRAGYQAGAARVRQLLEAQAGAAEARGDARGKEAFARALEELQRQESAAAFAAAQRLLDAGKPAEAAQAYEAIATEGAPSDAAGALHNAAIAWDRASDPARAAAARERIVRERPEAKVAPSATLQLAAYQSRKGDHATAARLYGEFLERWPDHANRCIAMQNVASELDTARKGGDAGERYLAFGKDPACARSDPALALTALRRAKVLLEAAGKPARAKEAAAAADAVRKPTKEK
jgi:hypothetical protein